MPKKEVRIIVAAEDVAAIIDEGSEVKTQLDNLTFKDKGIKAKITEVAEGQLQEGEGSVKLKGNLSAALVSASEKFTVNAGSDQYPGLLEAVKKGILVDVVEHRRSLVVPPASIDEAAEALQKAGITVTVTDTLTVKPADVRTMRERESSSLEETEARKSLEGCLSSDTSFRVKYEKV